MVQITAEEGKRGAEHSSDGRMMCMERRLGVPNSTWQQCHTPRNWKKKSHFSAQFPRKDWGGLPHIVLLVVQEIIGPYSDFTFTEATQKSFTPAIYQSYSLPHHLFLSRLVNNLPPNTVELRMFCSDKPYPASVSSSLYKSYLHFRRSHPFFTVVE